MSMKIDITKTDNSPLPNQFFVNNIVSTVRVKNLEAVAKNCVLHLVCMDDKEPSAVDLLLSGGKEVVGESWGRARVVGGSTWTTIGLPTYAPLFANISGPVLKFSLASSGYVDVEIMVIVPGNSESSGVTNFNVKVMAKNV